MMNRDYRTGADKIMNESLFRKTKNTNTSDANQLKRSEVDEMLVTNES